MSESSQDQKLQISSDNSDLISNNMDRIVESLDQSWELSKDKAVKLESKDKDADYNQQEQHEDVIVKLIDCVECYIPIPRCEIYKQNVDLNIKIEADAAEQIHEFREEQEMTPPSKQSSQLPNKDLYDDFEAFCHEK